MSKQDPKSIQASEHSSVSYVTIDERNDDQRLDNFLFSRFRDVPKSKIYRVIRKGEVRVNKKRSRAETRLFVGDTVRIPPVKRAPSVASEAHKPSLKWQQRLSRSIISDAQDHLVINKPTGIAVHGGSGVDYGVIEALQASQSNHTFLELVHRIDRETSGCLVIACSRKSLLHLQDQFRQGNVSKRYLALVEGRWPKKLSEINAPLLRKVSRSGDRYVSVESNGKPSLSQFRVLSSSDTHTLLEVNLLTGRTHQIRVHTAYTGHPVVGDEKYGLTQQRKPLRMMLHSWKLEFDDIHGQKHTIQAEPDEHFLEVLQSSGCQLND